jgi:ligand-binding SRPBCC domain-containing protein
MNKITSARNRSRSEFSPTVIRGSFEGHVFRAEIYKTVAFDRVQYVTALSVGGVPKRYQTTFLAWITGRKQQHRIHNMLCGAGITNVSHLPSKITYWGK